MVDILAGIFLVVVGGMIYFMPALGAHEKNRRHKNSITALNLFLGWTGIGWVAALVWALMEDKPNG